ncbi:sortase [Candidatus Microgenomates bacterium]|nr:MAG: sortase [Candidatus Microgenomates bacterium]
MQKIISRVCIVSGAVLLTTGLFLTWQRYNPNRLKFQYELSAPTPMHTVEPLILQIPAAHISVPIQTTALTDNRWPTTTQGVTYLANSPLPGDRGNSIMYGHNWENILGDLTKVKPGDTISVSFNNALVKDFRVSYVQIVSPDQTHVLSPTSDSRLTIYTCTGFLDSKRLVVVSEPIAEGVSYAQ